MVFDLEMIKNIYSSMKEKVDHAKSICKHPLTLSEKILYSHLWSNIEKPFERGVDYENHDLVLRRFIKIISEHANIKSLKIKFSGPVKPSANRARSHGQIFSEPSTSINL